MRSFASCLLALAAFGCYDPKLGPHPFLCGPPPERACPDGYSCDTVSFTCVQPGLASSATDAPVIPHDGGDDSDAGRFGITCSNDTAPDKDIEPNNTPGQADQGQSHLGSTVLCTPVAGQACNPFGHYTNFAICRPGDVDYYGMSLKQGDHLKIQVLFHVRVGDLDAAIVDSFGHLLTVSSGNQDNEALDFTAPADGKYYLLVEGFQNETNTYDLDFQKL